MPFDVKAVSKPLAGKPIWLWGLLGGVGVLGYYYWSASHKAAQAAANTGTGSSAPANTAIDAYPMVTNGSFTYGAPTDYTGGSVIADAGNALGNKTLETNLSWIAKGVTITGGGNAAKTALTHYLEGKPLTPKEADFVRTTRAVLGAAPESPNLAISVLANSVPVPASRNDVAKVNAPAKAPIISWRKPKAKTKAKTQTPEQIKAGAADAAARAALSQTTGNYTGSYFFNPKPATEQDFLNNLPLTNPANVRYL